MFILHLNNQHLGYSHQAHFLIPFLHEVGLLIIRDCSHKSIRRHCQAAKPISNASENNRGIHSASIYGMRIMNTVHKKWTSNSGNEHIQVFNHKEALPILSLKSRELISSQNHTARENEAYALPVTLQTLVSPKGLPCSWHNAGTTMTIIFPMFPVYDENLRMFKHSTFWI